MVDLLDTNQTAPAKGSTPRIFLTAAFEFTAAGRSTGRGIAASLSLIFQM
jgi:hypothetical protein